MNWKKIDYKATWKKSKSIFFAYRVPIMFAVFIATVLILSKCS